MKIIFVGIHNKPHLTALHSSTKTGKIIDDIIKELPRNIEILKTNLFDIDYLPISQLEIDTLHTEWYWQHLPIEDDIIILLGNNVKRNFRHDLNNIIKVAHPASKYSKLDISDYIKNTVELIKTKIYGTKQK